MNHNTHICKWCKEETSCGVAAFVCPWLNDDEDQFCEECLKKLADELEAFELGG